jgi:nucleotide-binding universal stress UspA family protein
MYKKVLVPLDQSSESEEVIPLIEGELAPDGEVILLQVVPPRKTKVIGGHVMYADQQQEDDRTKAIGFCRGVVGRRGGDPEAWHCEVTIADSVADGIVDYARREGVDLIAMYTHDRKGLAKLIKGSIAAKVKQSAPIEVRVFTPRELAAAT